MSNPEHDRLCDPLPAHYGHKRFRDVSLMEQHEILFRFLEEIYDELRAIRTHLGVADDGEEKA